MSNKIEEQEVIEAIPFEDNIKVYIPHDGEQEAYECGLGNEVSGDGSGEVLEEVDSNEMPMTIGRGCCVEPNNFEEEYDCTYVKEPDGVEENSGIIPGLGRGNTNPYMEVYPLDTQPFENATVAQTTENLSELLDFSQDNLPTILQNIITRYVYIRDTYKFITSNTVVNAAGESKVTEINTEAVVEFGSKLIPLLEKNISINTYCTKEIIASLADEISHYLANNSEFNNDVYGNLFDIIVDKVIPDSNNTLISYKEQYKSQMRNLVIPNMVEDVMIHFNSPEDNVDDILGMIATDMPDAEKYKIVKTDDTEFIIVIFGVEDGQTVYIPAVYVLKETETPEGDYSYDVTSRVSSQDEVDSLLTIYCDSSRWKI